MSAFWRSVAPARPGARDLARVAAAAGLALALSILYLAWPELDLIASGAAFDGERFVLSGNQTTRATRKALATLTAIVAISGVLAFVGTLVPAAMWRRWRRLGWGPWLIPALILRLPGWAWAWLAGVRAPEATRRPVLFVLACFLFGPAANSLMKELVGRARPLHTTEFGGDKLFSRVFVDAEQCATNCSFVSGDAATAVAFVSIALLRPRPRPLWLGLAALWSLYFCAIRLAAGKHFLSDVTLAAAFVLTIMAVAYALWMSGDRAARSMKVGRIAETP